MYAEFTKKKVFKLLAVGAQSPARHCHGRQTVLIPECDLTGTITLLPVRSHSGLLASTECPCTPLKISLPENETTVNPKSASFIIIMHLHKGLTHIRSQIKPWLIFGESL